MLGESHLYFHKAADVLGLPDVVRTILLTPYRSLDLDKKMQPAYQAVRETATQHDIDLRTTAFGLAIQRVGWAALSRVPIAKEPLF